jgi:hypothetical protein
MTFESRSSRASFFGRFADELTRETISPRDFRVILSGSLGTPQFKEDGHFVFQDLKPAPSYDIQVDSDRYQPRTITSALPANTMVELTFGGEDELTVLSTTIDAPQNRVNFANIPFLPTVAKGAAVRGPGGFSATLTETIEGTDVAFALLNSAAGLNNGDPLRFVRSPRMLLSPGPYYAFPASATLLGLTIVETTAGSAPIAGARIQILQVNAQAINTTSVGGVNLHSVTIPGVPAIPLMLGTDASLETRSDSRGRAIFYYAANSPITSLRLQITKPGYAATTVTAALTTGRRVQQTIPLTRT